MEKKFNIDKIAFIGRSFDEYMKMINKFRNKKIHFGVVFCLVFFAACVYRKPQLQLTRIAVEEIQWPQQAVEQNKTETTVLVGDLNKESFYTIRVKIPKGMKILPHYHPEERMVTIISGTLFVGYGDIFKEEQLKELPPGSFFTEPSNQPHFVWAKDDDVVVQATGRGPTKTTFSFSEK